MPPVDRTLTRVVVLMRVLGWAWLVVLSVVAVVAEDQEPDPVFLVSIVVVATLGTGLTLLASARGFLGDGWYVFLDAAIALGLAAAGWFSGFGEFIVGGYPVSWLFIVAYASNFAWTVVAGLAATGAFAVLHQLMGLGVTRLFGSIQFVVVAVVVGWAFDALRRREALRLEAEAERTAAEERLAEERAAITRLEERSAIARRLHDSVLQTLNLISASADDPMEVRYLSRVQQRDLRRTISEYESPYEDGFRARLLEAVAEVEDRYRVEVDQVINDDREMDERLAAVVDATAEVMNIAARHSGTSSIDLFAEIHDGMLQVSVRDRGSGYDTTEGGDGISNRVETRLGTVGGTVTIETAPGGGTSILMTVPLR